MTTVECAKALLSPLIERRKEGMAGYVIALYENEHDVTALWREIVYQAERKKVNVIKPVLETVGLLR